MKNKIWNPKLWISFVIYNVIPILPLFFKLLIDRDLDSGTVSISATMYIIGAGISSESFFLFIIYLFVAFLMLPVYVMAESPTSSSSCSSYDLPTIGFGLLIIVLAMGRSFFENYKFYVIECRPLDLKFGKDIINLISTNLTKNSGKSTDD